MPIQLVILLITVTFLATSAVYGWVVEGGVRLPSAPYENEWCAEKQLPAAIVGEFLNLTIFENPTTGLPEYAPVNFTLPGHTLISVTVTNYDNHTSQVPQAYSTVCGTINGTEEAGGKAVHSLPLDGIANTFTLTNGPYSGFNILVPPADARTATSISFETYFDITGTYAWQCEMNHGGSDPPPGEGMSGTLTVV